MTRNPDELEAIRTTLLPEAVALVKRHAELEVWLAMPHQQRSLHADEMRVKAQAELMTVNRKILAALTGLAEAEIRDEDAERAVYE